MLRIPRRLGSVLAVLLLLTASTCGGGDDDESTAPSSTSSPGGTPTSVAGTKPERPPVPYLALQAPGWTLTGGEAAPAGRDLPRGGVWAASYESRPSPERSVGAGLRVAEFSRTPNELARDIGPRPSPVTVNGVPAVAVEERSAAGGPLVDTHVLWNVDGYLVALTVYETATAEAVALAQNVKPVTEAEWRRAVDQAAAERPDD
jgi:hypothetical protein